MKDIILKILTKPHEVGKNYLELDASEISEIIEQWTAWIMKYAYYNWITKEYQRILTENYGAKKYTFSELFIYWYNEIYNKQ